MKEPQDWIVSYFDGERRTVRARDAQEAEREGRRRRPGIWILQVLPVPVIGADYIFKGKGAP